MIETRPRTALLASTLMTAVVVAMAGGAVHAALPAPDRVTFDSQERDAATGAPVRLTALRYAPASGAPSRGAVVALHGCGGIYSNVKGREDQPTPRHKAMAEMLVDEGYVVLFPDSFHARGRREICTVKMGERTVTQTNRRLDALGALAWLQTQPGIVPGRVALLGWSHGGGTVLAALNDAQPAVAEFRRTHDAPFFATAIAFYPGCSAYLTPPASYAPAAPVQIFIGADDDWTPAAPCVALGEAMAAKGRRLAVNVYPDSVHGFDAPGAGPRVRLDVPNGVSPGKGVSVGSNPAAREDAYARVKAILRDTIGQAQI